MTKIKATFRVTTPLFSGGADGQRAELRVPSFKGVLRFWWRACAWSHFGGDLDEIRDAEEQIFGGPNTGQSQVTIRFIGSPARVQTTSADGLIGSRLGARYLGYGLEDNERTGIPPHNLTVELRLRLHGSTDKQQDEQRCLLVNALRALGTCGGMGARSRRGYGSLALVALEGDVEPEPTTTRDELWARLTHMRNEFRKGSTDWPEYTAFSPHSRFLVGPEFSDSLAALNSLGNTYKEFRKATVGGPATLAAFGLPINYGEDEAAKPDAHERRASPLFFHIHECDGKALTVASFLPARFLPEQRESDTNRPPRPARIAIGNKKKPTRLPVKPPEELFKPVGEFLKHLKQQKNPFIEVGEGKR